MPTQSIPVTIVTNMSALLNAPATRGCTIVPAAGDLRDFARQIRPADLVALDNDWRRLVVACVLRPVSRYRLVAIDLILRTPRGRKAKAAAHLKRILLRGVDCFIFYFRDIRGVHAYYGIGPDRAVYVPFKVNGIEDPRWPDPSDLGDHVLCAGRTLRDIDTFLEAMARAGVPGVLLQQAESLLYAHGTRPAGPNLPPNVRLRIDRGDDPADFLARIAECRILVVPRFAYDIAATGISTYLEAMALGKPVIISAGPGADDILDGQAVIVPPQDSDALARAITRVWSDPAFAANLARRGRDYAASLGGEQRLGDDIREACLASLRSSRNGSVRHSRTDLPT